MADPGTTLPRRIHFDGGCRRRLREICVVAVLTDHAVVASGKVGSGNSLEAEWLALLGAVATGASLGLQRLHLIGDNLDVVELANRWVRPKSGKSEAFLKRYQAAIEDFESVEIEHVRRDLNLAGRYLEGGDSKWFRSGLSLLEGVEILKPVTNEIAEKVWTYVC